MSIIYEALKKVENKDNIPVINKPKRRPSSGGSVKKIAQVILLTVIVVVLVVVVRKRIKGEELSFSIPSRTTSSTKRKPTPRPTKPAPQKRYPRGNYYLEGIVYDEDSPSAIINGKVLRKNDRIDSFIVKEITPTTVKLYNSEDKTTTVLSF